MNTESINRIIVSRTDSIGDVMLTLPLCVWIKNQFPNIQLVFLCKSYTRDVVACFNPVDEIITLEELTQLTEAERTKNLRCDLIIHVFPNSLVAKWAKKAKIPLRIGTSHRIFHWLYCNKLVSFTRKNASLHEAQLNFNLCFPLGLNSIPEFKEIQEISSHFKVKKSKNPISEKKIIIHPMSQGSAVDYPLVKYVELAAELEKLNYQVFISGTQKEGEIIGNAFEHLAKTTMICGKYSLAEFIAFIASSDALIACSTGPLHIAAAMNLKAIGLFSPRKPIHPGRWKPLGINSSALVFDNNCQVCNEGRPCDCIGRISINQIVDALGTDQI